MTTVADIDALLATPKALGGAPKWVRDDRGTVSKLGVPILEAGVVGGLILQAHANLHTSPHRGGCVLVFEGRPVQRLTFKPDHAHTNPFTHAIPQPLRGRRLPPEVSRIHPWSLNRVWPRPATDNVQVAESLGVEPESFDTALTIFLDLCGIVGDLPPAPWEPRLL